MMLLFFVCDENMVQASLDVVDVDVPPEDAA